jgi:excinuclease ABC subunit C
MPSDEASRSGRSQDTESVLDQKLASLPVQPGCYVFKDKHGAVLYVGKAKSLRSRVRSYFQDGGSDVRAFIPFLRKHAADLETIVTATEKEAAVLENSLIKERKPRYNVKLRDDKEFLSLRLAAEHAFPRLELVRKPKKDGASYYGPYHSATAARRTLNLVEKHFKLRTCTDREMAGRKRPCLEYQIQRCLAPCVLEVDKELYGSQARAVGLFLEGRHDELTRDLKERMKSASQNLEFELAGMYRDQLSAVESAHEAQRVVVVSDRDQDVLGVYREGDLAELCIMVVRKGRMIDTATFSMKNVELPDDEVVATFLREHYGEGGSGEAHVPDEVIVPVLPEGVDGVSEWLMERRAEVVESRRSKVEVLAPARGPRRALLEMANDNAKHAFEEKRRAADDIDERLARVQERLRLPTLPRRIECCDISHLGGADTVGAVVALKDGQLDKKRYRTYIVRTVGEGDDYGAMYEVLSRRFRRGKLAKAKQEPNPAAAPLDGDEPDNNPENETEWQLPDLFVVDGGRGQLGVALTAAHDLGLHELCIVGLAKEKENVAGDKLVDRVYLPGQKNPIPLRPNSPELFLLARARDEAHRFSNRGRTKVGKRRRFGSELDAISGIGPKTRTSLLKTLGSLAAIRAATDAEILAVPGVTERHLRALREAFAAVRSASDNDVVADELAPDAASTEVANATDVGDAAPRDE